MDEKPEISLKNLLITVDKKMPRLLFMEMKIWKYERIVSKKKWMQLPCSILRVKWSLFLIIVKEKKDSANIVETK